LKAATQQDYRERIVRALVFIQEHLDEDLSLQRIASTAAFSPFHFHRVFHGLTGETVKEHVHRLRLERAAGDLKRVETPITEIAFRAGYETQEAFTRAFKAMFTIPPSAYRAAHRARPASTSGTHLGDVSGYHPPDYPTVPAADLKDLPPMQVVFLRHVGAYAHVGGTWARLISWAGMRGLLGPGMKLIGMVHDDPDVTSSDKIRYDAAVTVNRPVTPEGEFGVRDVAGGRYAVFTHKGPYERLHLTYQHLRRLAAPQRIYPARCAGL